MQHQPHPHAPPNYESKTQYATPLNDSKPLYKEGKKFIIRVTVTFLYYTRAVYGIFLAALSAITLEQSAPTELTMKKWKKLLDYSATHHDAILTY